jgi:hypothetical protein
MKKLQASKGTIERSIFSKRRFSSFDLCGVATSIAVAGESSTHVSPSFSAIFKAVSMRREEEMEGWEADRNT